MKWWRGKKAKSATLETLIRDRHENLAPAAATSAVGLVAVGFSAALHSGPASTARMHPPHQFPLNPWELSFHWASGDRLCLRTDFRVGGMWKVIQFHSSSCSPPCVPAMGGPACASAPRPKSVTCFQVAFLKERKE